MGRALWLRIFCVFYGGKLSIFLLYILSKLLTTWLTKFCVIIYPPTHFFLTKVILELTKMWQYCQLITNFLTSSWLFHNFLTSYYFSSVKNGSISFFCLLPGTNPTIFLDAMLQALILTLCLFHMYLSLFSSFFCLSLFALYIFITPSHRPNINNSFRIIFIKTIIIKVNIIKICSMKTHLITKKCDIIRICINKDYIIINN